MSKRAEAFEQALKALCVEHGVQLAVSGQGALQIWDAKPGGEPIYQEHIQDRTKPDGVKGVRLPVGTEVRILQDGVWEVIRPLQVQG
ncbi:hypothetical protein [Pseudorhodoferax sp. Leaf274]|uniref:hypothetical protein n=1 Tax=Pseudorhodoferax sp. Leaf274 TaxID=1736318 RepID=UPI0007026392|nr:hypothetical protein [Pseudorhodoferax sp. Leaf274]KQP43925.1 hypothetical protein ASF44_28775 [Pseudorhodoferax sp. Leaf274]